MKLDLSHDEAGVWGAADIQNVGLSTFEGVTVNDGVHFKVVMPTGEEHQFAGTLQGNNMIVGRLEGMAEEITFVRQ